jgi:hypothetical protein
LSRDRPTASGRHGLLSRVLERRRLDTDADEPQAQRQDTATTDDDQIAALEQRVNHLEKLVGGLQDAIHERETDSDPRWT